MAARPTLKMNPTRAPTKPKILSWIRTQNLTSRKSARNGRRFRICQARSTTARGKIDRRRSKRSRHSGAQSKSQHDNASSSSCWMNWKKTTDAFGNTNIEIRDNFEQENKNDQKQSLALAHDRAKNVHQFLRLLREQVAFARQTLFHRFD